MDVRGQLAVSNRARTSSSRSAGWSSRCRKAAAGASPSAPLHGASVQPMRIKSADVDCASPICSSHDWFRLGYEAPCAKTSRRWRARSIFTPRSITRRSAEQYRAVRREDPAAHLLRHRRVVEQRDRRPAACRAVRRRARRARCSTSIMAPMPFARLHRAPPPAEHAPAQACLRRRSMGLWEFRKRRTSRASGQAHSQARATMSAARTSASAARGLEPSRGRPRRCGLLVRRCRC